MAAFLQRWLLCVLILAATSANAKDDASSYLTFTQVTPAASSAYGTSLVFYAVVESTGLGNPVVGGDLEFDVVIGGIRSRMCRMTIDTDSLLQSCQSTRYLSPGTYEMAMLYAGNEDYNGIIDDGNGNYYYSQNYTITPAHLDILVAQPADIFVGQIPIFDLSVQHELEGDGAKGAIVVETTGALECVSQPPLPGNCAADEKAMTPGLLSVYLSYTGDGNFAAQPQVDTGLRFTVHKDPTTIAIDTLPHSIALGSHATISAIVSSTIDPGFLPTGSVTVSDAETSCTIDLNADPSLNTCAFTPVSTGNKNLFATYSGDFYYDASIALTSLSVSAAPVNGICGDVDGQTIDSIPTSGLCSVGTPSAVSGSGHPWAWTCAGSGGGVTGSCSATIQMWTVATEVGSGGTIDPTSRQVDNGQIGTFALSPAVGYVIESVTGCGGAPSGSTYVTAPVTANCTVSATFASSTSPIDGVCGSDNGKTLAVTPTNLCSAGTPSALSGSGPWTWTCSGIEGGNSATCSAQLQTIVPITTKTTLSAAPNPATINQPVTMRVVVSAAESADRNGERIEGGPTAVAPTGNAVVSDGAESCLAAIADGGGSCALTFAASGIHNLTAAYSGDANYAASSGSAQVLVSATTDENETTAAPTANPWILTLLAALLVAAYSVVGRSPRR